MERLTKWNGNRYVLPQGRTSDGESYWRIVAEKLAAYENTGLTPEEINDLINKEVKRKLTPYERTKRQVYATGNKYAIENFNATHN